MRVAIIGLGKITCDFGGPDDDPKWLYNHLGGIMYNERASLAGVADLSTDAIEAFKAKWGATFPDTPCFTYATEMIRAVSPDVVAVCVKGPYHFKVMEQVLSEEGVRAVFLEKPATCSLDEMDRMMALAKKANTPITVSYTRHWGPHLLKTAELVRDGIIGDVEVVTGHCGGTVLSYAAHTTDMICQFAGSRPVSVMATGTRKGEAPEGYEVEPELGGMLINFENGVTGIQLGGAGESGSFYVHVTGTKGRLRAGFYSHIAAWGADNQPLDLTPYDIPALRCPFIYAYEQIADHLEDGPKPDCTDDEFIAVHELGFGAIESIDTGRLVTLPNTRRDRLVYANG